MNLRDLHYLVVVADLKSFVKAAKHCCISQPTLSTQIKKLETTLGIKVFERNNKKVLITPLGEQIVNSAQAILREVEHIETLAKNSQNPLAGDFKLGAFPTLATYIFPSLVPLIKQQLPTLRLILIEEKTNVLITQLKEGKIDAALLAWPINENDLSIKTLFDDPFKLAVTTGHPLAKKKLIKAEDLLDQPLLLLDEGHCLRDQALQFCQLNDVEEQQNVRATGLETLRQMVSAGTGITFMPQIAIHPHEKGICYIPFAQPQPKRTICLVWRKSSPRIELLKQIQTLICQAHSLLLLNK